MDGPFPHDRRHDPRRPFERDTSSGSGSAEYWAGSSAAPPPKLIFYDDIPEVQPPKDWLIKGVLACGERSAWIAPPKGGKSALLVSIAHAVTSGRDWRGHRVKNQGGVLYLAYERSGGLTRKLSAYKARYRIPSLPFVVGETTMDLMDEACVENIRAMTQTIEQRYRVPVRLIVIDTFAKAISAGGGDENLPKDQGKLLNNLERIRAKTGAHIAIIGHTGKDETRGMRGANAVLGDVDLMVEIATDPDGMTRRATITGGNDVQSGPLTAYRLTKHVFGQDEDGDENATWIVDPEPVEENEARPGWRAEPAGRKRLPRHVEALRDAFHEAVTEGVTVSRVMGDGPLVETVPMDRVRDNFKKRFVTGETDPKKASNNERQAWKRALEHLSALKLASGKWEDVERVWSTVPRDRRDNRDKTDPVTPPTDRDRRDRDSSPLKGGADPVTPSRHGMMEDGHAAHH